MFPYVVINFDTTFPATYPVTPLELDVAMDWISFASIDLSGFVAYATAPTHPNITAIDLTDKVIIVPKKSKNPIVNNTRLN